MQTQPHREGSLEPCQANSQHKSSGQPLVYVIVLNWNAYAYTQDCVESLLRLTYPHYEIVIVDNASSDDSAAILQRSFPDLTVLQSGGNLGYAGGNNVGIDYACRQGAEYIWLVNNDTHIDPQALTALVEALESKPQAGIAGSKIYYMDEPNRISYAGGHVDFIRGKTLHRGDSEIDVGQYDQIEDVDFITGCSLLIRSSVIANLGKLCESYFLYFEDAEWSLRVKKAGYKLLYVPNSILWHKVSGTAGEWNPNVTYYYVRNGLYLFEQHFAPAQRLTATVWHLLHHLRYLGFTIQRRKQFGKHSIATVQGIWDYLWRVNGKRLPVI
jgi:GT2 family glycosyltransferase